MLILRRQQSKFSALLPFKSTSSLVSYNALVDILVQPTNSDFARFVGSLLTAAIHIGASAALHRGLIAFHAGMFMAYMTKSHAKLGGGAVDEGSLAWLTASILEPLRTYSELKVKAHSQLPLVTEAIVRLPHMCVSLHVNFFH